MNKKSHLLDLQRESVYSLHYILVLKNRDERPLVTNLSVTEAVFLILQAAVIRSSSDLLTSMREPVAL